MSEYITVTLKSIQESGVWVWPVRIQADCTEYKLTPADAQRIIEGYNRRIQLFRDRITELETELAQYQEKIEITSIPTGNRYGGGYGD